MHISVKTTSFTSKQCYFHITALQKDIIYVGIKVLRSTSLTPQNIKANRKDSVISIQPYMYMYGTGKIRLT